ncbi:MAG: NAD(P)H-hydrate dehydratase [Acidobacteria bacterium]|jgi:NAD(P)H-hydrate epimerase|nr:NAD(P)H-hydrate dehydratase [Acidobacteriota bacterium]
MIPVLTADEMRRADRVTIDEIGLPGAVLMENAGAAVAASIRERFPDARRIVVLCGKGNNGGDGFVVARRLRSSGAEALLLGRKGDVKGHARIHLDACERSGGAVREVVDPAAWAAALERVRAADLLVDALLGTGLRSAPTGLAADAVAELGQRAKAGVPVVSVDIPSGVGADGGALDAPAVPATLTVTFAAAKRGHVLPPACECAGDLVIADIGIPSETLAAVKPSLFLLEDADAAAAFPPRLPAAHKGDLGHLLVVAGSLGKTGAAILAAGGALRAGAGLVTVATPASCVSIVAGGRAEIMTEALPETPSGGVSGDAIDRLLALAGERDAVVLGPGLGQDPSTRALVLEFVRRCPVPLLIDADGLNALAAVSGGPWRDAVRERPAATLLTPHPGEMARLVGRGVPEIQRQRVEEALRLAEESGAVIVLKGQRTVVGEPGGRAAVSPTGNPGMASGGTGDVLSGVIGALLARHDGWLAATAGVYVHGRAGDLAAQACGEEGLAAGDLQEALPRAIESVRPPAGGT